MLGADLGNDGTLASDDLGVILGVHSDGQLKAPESLQQRITHLSVNSSTVLE